MEHILQSLEQNIILSDEIVLDIKQSIRRNHPSADSRYRARLLAQSLHEKTRPKPRWLERSTANKSQGINIQKIQSNQVAYKCLRRI